MDNKILKAINISHSVGGASILSNISLDIAEGKTISITGASGSGKSTLMHILSGLMIPTQGEVYINNTNVYLNQSDNNISNLRNTQVGFVYQFHHLIQELSVIDNIIIPGIIKGLNKKSLYEKATHLLECLKIQTKIKQFPNTLSGGEKQRVAIARALINNPAIIFADEPTGNLDEENAHIVFDLMLNAVRENKTTFIVVTHDKTISQQTDVHFLLHNNKIVNLSN